MYRINPLKKVATRFVGNLRSNQGSLSMSFTTRPPSLDGSNLVILLEVNDVKVPEPVVRIQALYAGVTYIYQPETDQEKQQLGDLYELVQYQMSGGPEILDHMLQEIKDLGV